MSDEFNFADLGILEETVDNDQADYLYLQTLLDKKPPFSSGQVRQSLTFAVNKWFVSEFNIVKIKLVLHNGAPAWGCIYRL